MLSVITASESWSWHVFRLAAYHMIFEPIHPQNAYAWHFFFLALLLKDSYGHTPSKTSEFNLGKNQFILELVNGIYQLATIRALTDEMKTC